MKRIFLLALLFLLLPVLAQAVVVKVVWRYDIYDQYEITGFNVYRVVDNGDDTVVIEDIPPYVRSVAWELADPTVCNTYYSIAIVRDETTGEIVDESDPSDIAMWCPDNEESPNITNLEVIQ